MTRGHPSQSHCHPPSPNKVLPAPSPVSPAPSTSWTCSCLTPPLGPSNMVSGLLPAGLSGRGFRADQPPSNPSVAPLPFWVPGERWLMSPAASPSPLTTQTPWRFPKLPHFWVKCHTLGRSPPHSSSAPVAEMPVFPLLLAPAPSHILAWNFISPHAPPAHHLIYALWQVCTKQGFC